jgi:hypothetical protein
MVAWFGFGIRLPIGNRILGTFVIIILNLIAKLEM